MQYKAYTLIGGMGQEMKDLGIFWGYLVGDPNRFSVVMYGEKSSYQV